MIEEYKYRPPFKYLFVGLGTLPAAFLMGMASILSTDSIWFCIVTGLFSLLFLLVGIGFLTIFIRKFNVGNLKIGTDFIVIPGRLKDPIRLNFDQIQEIGEFDTYDNVIEIISDEGVHLIERNWMKQKEFDAVKSILETHWLHT
jgi:hypothetical protein